MRKIKYALLAALLVCALCLTACGSCRGPVEPGQENPPVSDPEGSLPPAGTVAPSQVEIPEGLEENKNTMQVSCVSGTPDCWSFAGNVLTFSGLTEDTVCALSGDLNGQIAVDAGDLYKLELELCGVTLYSATDCPLTVISGNKAVISAKKGTQNYIYDLREALPEADETAKRSALWSACDLQLEGKGELTVISSRNNGIHSTDGLSVKNLTLSVSCADNALKGNDGVEITGGILSLIARSGDGIKSANSDLSAKGNQRGTVSVTGGTVRIYAARDGIDAAYDAEVGSDAIVDIYTDSFSSYTGTEASLRADTAAAATASRSSTQMRLSPTANGGYGGRDPGGYGPGGGGPGGGGGFNPGGGGGFGPGGFGDGNNEKTDYSCKGIKAANEIRIFGGTLTVQSGDDALHAGSDTALENGKQPAGNITVSDGNLAICSNGDGIHADSILTVTGGTVRVTESYEGLEGTQVEIAGGSVSVISRDDGINATATTGTGITFTGGNTYIYAGGDGVDANSRSQYEGIRFVGGSLCVVSTSGGNSSIDTEQGYEYTGGTVLALCPSNGMGSESTKCRNFSAIGCKTTMNLKESQTLVVSEGNAELYRLDMPCNLSALVIFLGSPNASFKTE